jgi:TPR repeat protein
MHQLPHVLAVAILVLSMVTSVLAGPFEDALAAYNRQDYARAVQLLRPIAESGNVRAQFLLGFMYEGGMGVPEDDTEAAKWYRRAADTGDDYAQYHMGVMHRDGQGVPRDLVRAYMWLDLAAMRGHQGAAMDRDRLAGSMSAAQIAEAQELARKWKAKEP